MTAQATNQVKTLFPLGQLVATPAALATTQTLNISASALITRHLSGDWGDLCADDLQANNDALNDEGRLFSAYKFEAVTLWVITEADRSATTLLLPNEY